MLVYIHMKDPDGVQDSLQDAVAWEVRQLDKSLSDDEREAVMDIRYSEISEAVDRFFRHGEYVTIVIDTEKNTATVEEV